MNDVTA